MVNPFGKRKDQKTKEEENIDKRRKEFDLGYDEGDSEAAAGGDL
ncbi:MAG: hypothetical protein CM15mP71_2760 [Candidatus Poseidoniales archaeon]|nr:MAG: hypothetical protein CM15mP71_2760 [Candidatus Poseidoniales archaeon]